MWHQGKTQVGGLLFQVSNLALLMFFLIGFAPDIMKGASAIIPDVRMKWGDVALSPPVSLGREYRRRYGWVHQTGFASPSPARDAHVGRLVFCQFVLN